MFVCDVTCVWCFYPYSGRAKERTQVNQGHSYLVYSVVFDLLSGNIELHSQSGECVWYYCTINTGIHFQYKTPTIINGYGMADTSNNKNDWPDFGIVICCIGRKNWILHIICHSISHDYIFAGPFPVYRYKNENNSQNRRVCYRDFDEYQKYRYFLITHSWRGGKIRSLDGLHVIAISSYLIGFEKQSNSEIDLVLFFISTFSFLTFSLFHFFVFNLNLTFEDPTMWSISSKIQRK